MSGGYLNHSLDRTSRTKENRREESEERKTANRLFLKESGRVSPGTNVSSASDLIRVQKK